MKTNEIFEGKKHSWFTKFWFGAKNGFSLKRRCVRVTTLFISFKGSFSISAGPGEFFHTFSCDYFFSWEHFLWGKKFGAWRRQQQWRKQRRRRRRQRKQRRWPRMRRRQRQWRRYQWLIGEFESRALSSFFNTTFSPNLYFSLPLLKPFFNSLFLAFFPTSLLSLPLVIS